MSDAAPLPLSVHSEDVVFLHLQQLVAAADITPGHKLPSERKLADTLGVRRSAVRDVMHTMRTFGLVQSRRGSGTYLCDDLRSYASLHQVRQRAKTYGQFRLMESRRIIEGEITALAASRAEDTHIDQLAAALARMASAHNWTEFLRHDFAFHAGIAEASGNIFLLEMLNITRDMLLDSNERLLRSPGQSAIAYTAHERILAAVRARDPERARKEMVRHLEQIERVFQHLHESGEL